MYEIVVPTHLRLSQKGKLFPLNLNFYRNAHHRTLHAMKLEFDRQVKPKLQGLPKMEQVNLTFTLFTGTAQRVDTANVCCIVDKFFSDSLVNADRISDDNYEVVLSSTYRYGGIHQGDPHVMITIEPCGKITQPEPSQEEETMQIIIVQSEIEEAIRNHILNQISINDNMDILIDLAATRGAEGFKATIDILPKSDESSSAGKTLDVAAKVTAAKKTTKAAPVEEVAASDEPTDTDPVSEEEVSEEVAAATKPSLFGSLKKPVNEPAPADAE